MLLPKKGLQCEGFFTEQDSSVHGVNRLHTSSLHTVCNTDQLAIELKPLDHLQTLSNLF